MQSYPLNLNPQSTATAISAQADLFVYESGTTTPDGGERRLIIKPDNGQEIVLRPGQRFRLAPGSAANQWSVRLYDATVTLAANIIIGSGEFDDANTLNTFKLDASFANNVNVTNDAAHRVPVTLDLSQKLQLDPSVPLNIAGSTVQYTNAWADATIAATVATPIFTAAQNPNGAYIEFAEMALAGTVAGGSAATTASLIVKATAPVNSTDGDVVMVATAAGQSGTPGSINQVNQILGVRIKIAAGKGLYLNQNGNGTAANKTVLYTLL